LKVDSDGAVVNGRTVNKLSVFNLLKGRFIVFGSSDLLAAMGYTFKEGRGGKGEEGTKRERKATRRQGMKGRMRSAKFPLK